MKWWRKAEYPDNWAYRRDNSGTIAHYASGAERAPGLWQLKTNEQSLQAADIGLNLLPLFSVLSHSIKDANTLECLIGPAPPRSQVHHLVGKGKERQCTLMAFSTNSNRVGGGWLLKVESWCRYQKKSKSMLYRQCQLGSTIPHGCAQSKGLLSFPTIPVLEIAKNNYTGCLLKMARRILFKTVVVGERDWNQLQGNKKQKSF